MDTVIIAASLLMSLSFFYVWYIVYMNNNKNYEKKTISIKK